jgi:serine/threonine protein kinase/tetratricopeptide (TPR) repeat protein
MAETTDPTLAMNVTLHTIDPGGATEDTIPLGSIRANRFRLDALLGEGGMGAVYRAYDLELEEVVALKTLRAHIASDARAIERFRREVKLARRVTHPNVARTFDLSRCGALRFMTMEFIEGISLARKIEQGPVALADALRITADIARGLVAAHAAGVVHRDLKPDNVMLSIAGAEQGRVGCERVVITDFGIARASNTSADTHEQPMGADPRALTVGGVVGTPAYMAPEQLMGESPDGRSDVYALGIVLFELLTSKLPFEGPSAVAIAMARLTREPPDVRELDPELPESVSELLTRMLARERGSRPDSTVVLDHLERLRGARTGPSDPGVANVPVLPRATATVTDLLVRRPVRSVAVLPIGSAQPALDALARQLGETLADGLSRVKSLQVIPPGFLVGPDPLSTARAQRAELALSGTLRGEGGQLRVNLRYVDPAEGTQRWAERVDGALEAPFALEDTLTRTAEAALHALAVGTSVEVSRAPTDPVARGLYERALERAAEFTSLEAMREALAQAREAHARAPTNAAVMSLIGLVLVRMSASFQNEDTTLVSEAESWALRALDADASAARTYTTLGLVRLHQGEPRESIRAFREALARDPREVDANGYIGRFLVESGYLDEGIERLEFALRLSPTSQVPALNLGIALGLRGDFARSERVLDQAAAQARNGRPFLVLRARMASWARDPAHAERTADAIEQSGMKDPFVTSFLAPLRALQHGRPIELWHLGAPQVDALNLTPSRRAFWQQIRAESAALRGVMDEALEAIEALPSLPFIDLGWMDRCPLFEPIRGSGRFGRVRAIIVHRSASLWT